MGSIQYLFFKRATTDYISSEASSFNGRRIGALTGAQYQVAEKFLSDHHVQAQLVQYNDIKERDKARPDILAELDQAQHRLYHENPYFISDLTKKWFSRSSFTTTLSKVERKWLAEHSTFTVGYLEDYLPYSATDSDGNVTGVVKDIMPEIFKSLNFTKIKISYKGYANITELNEALHNHEVDVIFPVVSNYWITEIHDVVPSIPAVSSYFNVLYAGEYPDLAKAKVAVSKRNGIMDDYRMVYYPNSEFSYFNNAYDCLDVVL